ncbi:Hypothetical protein Ccan_20600 [Capnocytophaga canimorsus Cc5]|uniref:Uncharacterized protein n=1 Tax=Capnocytophaga canimorsus (strain 5) TaxID=860228 RepID=F9YU58_CAPCC|nr:Hypothetical protein Ccan_20600 [Capnocytophaga canimorsus Cc5]
MESGEPKFTNKTPFDIDFELIKNTAKILNLFYKKSFIINY